MLRLLLCVGFTCGFMLLVTGCGGSDPMTKDEIEQLPIEDQRMMDPEYDHTKDQFEGSKPDDAKQPE